MNKLRTKESNYLFDLFVLVLALMTIFSATSSFGQYENRSMSIDQVGRMLNRNNIKIQYLTPLDLRISSQGINRLHFDKARIVKIVGDSSLYEVILSENGSDLFFVSKVSALELINLTLLLANGEALDLRLHVSDEKEPKIIMVNQLISKNKEEAHLKQEINAMINKMVQGNRGKYFVQAKKRLIAVPNKSGLVLNQYITYRFGDLGGAGFTCSIKEKNMVEPSVTTEELKGVFKDILAISVVNVEGKVAEKTREFAKVFVVFKVSEGMDV